MNRSPRLLRALASTLTGALAGTACLVGGALAPAHAADGVVTVTGSAFQAAGLTYIAESCTTPFVSPPVQPVVRHMSGGTSGTSATGLSYDGALGYEAGMMTRVASPSTVSSVRVDTYTPAGPDPDTDADGHFVVIFPTTADGAGSFFYAYRGVDLGHTGWGTTNELATVPLSWHWYDGVGNYQSIPTTRTIAQMGQAYGDRDGASIGYQFGCNGRDYYMDSFVVASAAGRTVYDFEAPPAQNTQTPPAAPRQSLTVLATPAEHHHHGAPEVGVERVEIVAGQGHWLGGATGDAEHLRMGHGVWTSGVLTLMQRAAGASSFAPQGPPTAFDDTTGAWVKIYPKRQTTYYFSFAGNTGFTPSTSLPLRIDVRRWMRATASHRTVLRGRPITVTGRIEPGDKRVRTRLQLKDGRRWRTVDSTRTRAKGRYALATRPSRAGVAKYRVLVAAADGNLGNVSPTMRITVKKPTPKPAPPPRRDDSVDVTTYVPEVEEDVEVRVPNDDIPARPLPTRPGAATAITPAEIVGNAPAKAR